MGLGREGEGEGGTDKCQELSPVSLDGIAVERYDFVDY